MNDSKETTVQTTTSTGNSISITLENRREQLPEPTKVSTALGDVVFCSLMCAFTSAALTQVLLLLPVSFLSNERLLSAVVGCCLFGAGLEWTISKQVPNVARLVSLLSVIAGVVLGG